MGRWNRKRTLGIAFAFLLGSIAILFSINLWIKAEGRKQSERVEQALQRIQVSHIEFSETALSEAVRELNRQIFEKDQSLGPKLVVIHSVSPLTPISLQLPRASSLEALRYTSSLAQSKYAIIRDQVVIAPLHADFTPFRNPIERPFNWLAYEWWDLQQNRWPEWMSRIRGLFSLSTSADDDPFSHP